MALMRSCSSRTASGHPEWPLRPAGGQAKELEQGFQDGDIDFLGRFDVFELLEIFKRAFSQLPSLPESILSPVMDSTKSPEATKPLNTVTSRSGSQAVLDGRKVFRHPHCPRAVRCVEYLAVAFSFKRLSTSWA